MKRRIVKKINRYKVLPPRLVNKAMYIAFRIQKYWSFGINSKKYYTVYIMDKWGRVLMYSRTDRKGRVTYGHGYRMWNEDELYHIRNKQ